MRLSWLFGAFIFAAALVFLQHWALADFLYWRFPWFDTLMHFLGGLTVATFAIGLLYRPRILLFALMMCSVAIGWEVFEFSIGTVREANFVLDTGLDLLMDTVGMSASYLVARLTLWRSA